MITCYFGTPGCGKTTLLAKIAQTALKKRSYEHVYSNFPCFGCEPISVNDLCSYRFGNSLILLDELTLDVDSRDYKNFNEGLKEYVTMHRHDGARIIYFVQDYSRVDKTIRNCTFDLWYLSTTTIPFLRNFSIARRVFRHMDINEYQSEIVYGYRFRNKVEAITISTVKIIFRPLYYKYFDSYDLGCLSERSVYQSNGIYQPDIFSLSENKLSKVDKRCRNFFKSLGFRFRSFFSRIK